MRKIATLLLSLLAITTVSCGGTSWSVGPDPSKTKYRISYTADDFEAPININYEFDYNMRDFDKDSTKFNKSIALLSFAKELMATNSQNITSYYTDLGFDDVHCAGSFVEEEKEDSIGFALAHYGTEDYHLISVATNGITYKKPWANNFVLGLEGDAEGFVIAAEQVIGEVKSYIENYTDKTVKLWISGFSRTAAVANIVSYRLIDDETFEESNLFAYAFEAPQAVSTANTKEYNSIFNIMNRADLVTHVAPVEYGLKRIGRDIDLHNDKIDSWLSAIDSRLKLQPFQSQDGASDEGEFLDSVFECMMDTSVTFDKNVGLDTREHYVLYHQEDLSYVVGLFIGLKFSTLKTLLEKLGEEGLGGMLGLLGEDGLYNFIKPILDECGESYDDAKLKKSTNGMAKMALGLPSVALVGVSLVLSEAYQNSFIRCLEFHFPEVVLVSLYNYQA